MMILSFSLLFSFALIRPSIAGYGLADNLSGKSFFSAFDFFTDADPTDGFVKYVDLQTAASSGLIGGSDNQTYIGVDHTNQTPQGRPSVRLTSKKTYNQGLFVADILHMPGGVCGTWPAFWMVGPDWPQAGEIDILEGVNDQATNAMTLHTSAGCVNTNSDFSGSVGTKNCDVNAADQDKNAGCKITDANQNSYGSSFNSNQGGVYAMEWTSRSIKIWFFPRSSVPADLQSGNPDPTQWGQPSGQFGGQCDMTQRFHDLQIVFDTTFCGQWAGQTWSTSSTCRAKPSGNTCEGYVANNPQDFGEAYWQIQSVKVFQQGGQNGGSGGGYSRKRHIRHGRSHVRAGSFT